MWALVTRARPPLPPACIRYRFPPEDAAAPPDAPLTMGWTFAGDLFGPGVYEDCDPALRMYIARCLDLDPQGRPKIAWMEKAISTNLARADLRAAESDEQLRAAARRIFREP